MQIYDLRLPRFRDLLSFVPSRWSTSASFALWSLAQPSIVPFLMSAASARRSAWPVFPLVLKLGSSTSSRTP